MDVRLAKVLGRSHQSLLPAAALYRVRLSELDDQVVDHVRHVPEPLPVATYRKDSGSKCFSFRRSMAVGRPGYQTDSERVQDRPSHEML